MQVHNKMIVKNLMGLALTAMIALSASAFAAERGRSHQDPLQRLQERLNLSQEQVDQLRPTFAAMREERKSERGQFRAELQSVLTPDQLARLDAEGGRRHGMRDLNLTADQKEQLKGYWEQTRPQMKSEHRKMNEQVMAVLTPEQQAKFKQMQRHRRHHENRERTNADE